MRKHKEDWLEAGLRMLSLGGIKGLTIEHMTPILGVTKGSFYHHFESMNDFKHQLIGHWANQYLSTSAEYPEDPDERLRLLDTIMTEGFGSITEPEVAIRIWAHQDENVRAYVERIDSVRRDFVLHVFRPFADDDHEAQLMADMLFAMTIGSITALPRLSNERVLEMYQRFKQLFDLKSN